MGPGLPAVRVAGLSDASTGPGNRSGSQGPEMGLRRVGRVGRVQGAEVELWSLKEVNENRRRGRRRSLR